MNSEEGGWQIFESRLLKGEARQAFHREGEGGRAGGGEGGFGTARFSPKRSARESRGRSTLSGSSATGTKEAQNREGAASAPPSGKGASAVEQVAEGHEGVNALEIMKNERLDAIFRLLDSRGEGLIHLPSADLVGCLKDREVAQLVSEALSLYSSTAAATGYGQFITAGDFKRACFDYFANKGLQATRKTFPWKTILAYNKASTVVLPGAANRALQAFEQELSMRSGRENARNIGHEPSSTSEISHRAASDSGRPAVVPVLQLDLAQPSQAAMDKAKALAQAQALSPTPIADVSEDDCGVLGGAGVSPAPLHGMSSPFSGEVTRAARDPSKSRRRPFTADGRPRVIAGGAEARSGSGGNVSGSIQGVTVTAPEERAGGTGRLQSLALPREKHNKRQAWIEVRGHPCPLCVSSACGKKMFRLVLMLGCLDRRCGANSTSRR